MNQFLSDFYPSAPFQYHQQIYKDHHFLFNTHLILVKFESEDVDKGGRLTGVALKEGEKEISLIQVTLKCL